MKMNGPHQWDEMGENQWSRIQKKREEGYLGRCFLL